jgi:hypothetical protein
MNACVENMMDKMYIAVLDEFPDYMVPTLVAHSVLAAHLKFQDDVMYKLWLEGNFRKVVLRVNQKEFDKISALPNAHIGHEKKTLDGRDSCVVVCPNSTNTEMPNVLKFAKLWSPKND